MHIKFKKYIVFILFPLISLGILLFEGIMVVTFLENSFFSFFLSILSAVFLCVLQTVCIVYGAKIVNRLKKYTCYFTGILISCLIAFFCLSVYLWRWDQKEEKKIIDSTVKKVKVDLARQLNEGLLSAMKEKIADIDIVGSSEKRQEWRHKLRKKDYTRSLDLILRVKNIEIDIDLLKKFFNRSIAEISNSHNPLSLYESVSYNWKFHSRHTIFFIIIFTMLLALEFAFISFVVISTKFFVELTGGRYI
ncbi:MAG: hypothetical protein OEV44_09685 [Spirochaetota bacterium]|nr:hypothetical protein [Spirochaetota bacterium]